MEIKRRMIACHQSQFAAMAELWRSASKLAKSVFAPLIAPYEGTRTDFAPLLPPSGEHLLGTAVFGPSLHVSSADADLLRRSGKPLFVAGPQVQAVGHVIGAQRGVLDQRDFVGLGIDQPAELLGRQFLVGRALLRRVRLGYERRAPASLGVQAWVDAALRIDTTVMSAEQAAELIVERLTAGR